MILATICLWSMHIELSTYNHTESWLGKPCILYSFVLWCIHEPTYVSRVKRMEYG